MPKIFSPEDLETIRTRLLQAGIAQLEHRSFRSIAVDELTAEAGIAKGTFYRFFPSKEAYFYEIICRIREKNREALTELFQDGCPDRDRIVRCLYRRYTGMKSVYTYFTPEEIHILLRKLPEEERRMEDDSLTFARMLGESVRPFTPGELETVVGMFNILGVAAAANDRSAITGFAPAVQILCETIADYIVGDTR